jgi:hypothetical protein
MTILNSIPMGGLDHAFLFVSLDNSATPEKEYSCPPTNRAILVLVRNIKRGNGIWERVFSGVEYFWGKVFLGEKCF